MSRGREPGEKVARVRLGSYEFRKRGVSRFDLPDPYHLAVALTWPQFLAPLFLLYLSVNIAFTTLFWLAPGSAAPGRAISTRFTTFNSENEWFRTTSLVGASLL
jgi:inward rectifier potassium channel